MVGQEERTFVQLETAIAIDLISAFEGGVHVWNIYIGATTTT